MECHDRSRMLLQFHITGRCNLQCKHCYRTEGDVEPLSYEDVIAVFEQFKDLNLKLEKKRKAHINITGGEPFFREDIGQILRYLGENEAFFTYGVLSNGSFINEQMVQLLRQTKVSFVQLSIDGKKETHDFLRAHGDYERVFCVASNLEREGIRTYISFTANKENYKDLPSVAAECRRRGITKLWSDRLVPIGNGQEIRHLAITEKEFPQYLRSLKKARGNFFTRNLYPKTQVAMDRALQFINSKGCLYSCSAGESLITVDEFGNIMPCRRMPIPCGNVFDSTLSEVYFKNDVFKALRMKATPKECAACKYAYFCKGGARCQSYAVYGSYFRADPACSVKK